ncbi:uncharacterized protein [Periplaneta americana]|uniref:uncharacterized protein isoform X2 n=1 Tax=Periplaneta americana TaxID=6978 RepID=UPI0037E87463
MRLSRKRIYHKGNNMGAALCSALGHDESGSRPCPFPKFKQQHLKVYSKQEIVEDGSFSQSGSSQNSESEARSETDKIVTEPWKRFMTDMKGNGMKTFIIFLTYHPQYKSKIERLDKMTLKEIEEDEQMQRNVITAMCYITTIVHTLDYPESTRVVVQDIKNYCRDFDLPDKALAVFKEVFIKTMKFERSSNDSSRESWNSIRNPFVSIHYGNERSHRFLV